MNEDEAYLERQRIIDEIEKFNTNAGDVYYPLYQQWADYYVEGHTLQQAGDKFGVSRERIRQILVKLGVTDRQTWKLPPPERPPKMTHELYKARAFARFWANIDITADPDECWEWQGLTHKLAGYPRVSGGEKLPWREDRGVRGQVLAWYRIHGMEPTGWIMNTCRNQKCLNPNHLTDISPKEAINKYRSTSRQRAAIDLGESKFKV